MPEFLRKEKARQKFRRQDAKDFIAEVSVETVDDWTDKNAQSYEWTNDFRLSVATIVLTKAFDQALMQDAHNPYEYWKRLRSRYPDLVAVYGASRVGFNRARTEAVVLVGFTVGPTGGEGDYILLKKEAGVWKIAHRLPAWIS